MCRVVVLNVFFFAAEELDPDRQPLRLLSLKLPSNIKVCPGVCVSLLCSEHVHQVPNMAGGASLNFASYFLSEVHSDVVLVRAETVWCVWVGIDLVLTFPLQEMDDGVRFPAHKIILCECPVGLLSFVCVDAARTAAASSTVLRSFFESGMVESVAKQVPIHDVTHSVCVVWSSCH
jgi:hypothetical protein